MSSVLYNLQIYAPETEEDAHQSFLTRFAKSLNVDVVEDTDERIIFDLIGVDAPIANALRRILISDVRVIFVRSCVVYLASLYTQHTEPLVVSLSYCCL